VEPSSCIINAIAYSPDGRRLLVGSVNTIKEWDRETGQRLSTFEGDSNYRISAMAYSPNGQRVIFVSDYTIQEWDRETGQCIWVNPLYRGINIIGCSFNDCKFSSDEVKELIRVYGGKV
jgi:WD40 repeat protein